MNYQNIWKRVEILPWCVLVTTGRTGTDFFQSLLDSHPEVFVFNGSLYFHTFWESCRCVRFSDDPGLEDIMDEFIGAHIESLKSRYEPSERKDRLGDSQDKSIDIDTGEFKGHVLGLLKGRPVTSRNVMTAVYVAYELCLGRGVTGKKLFLHHVHHVRKVDDVIADFPEAKIICMTRDPRALYVSGVENWRKYEPKADHPHYPLYMLWRAVDESRPLQNYNDGRLRLLRFESLAHERTLRSVCDWLDISFHPCLKESTWAGMRWWGDKISQNEVPENERGFSKTMATNKWEKKLGWLDKAVLNYLLVDLLDWYGYPHNRSDGILMASVMALLILLPMGYERRYLSFWYLGRSLAEGKFRNAVGAFYHPLRRVIWFYKLFHRRNFGKSLIFPFLGDAAYV